MSFAAGQKVTADQLNGVTGIAANLGTAITTSSSTTTSVPFTATLADGVVTGVTFTALDSGTALLMIGADIKTSTVGFASCSAEIRQGSTIGSGTVVLAASDNHAYGHNSTNEIQGSRIKTVTGLTPGQVYNARLMYKVSAGTGTFLRREITVVPL